jgi:hypothetical protein
MRKVHRGMHLAIIVFVALIVAAVWRRFGGLGLAKPATRRRCQNDSFADF